MYRIHECASFLNIDSYEIHHILLEYNDILDKFLKKDRGITYIDEDGVLVIKTILDGSFERAKPVTETLQSDSSSLGTTELSQNEIKNEELDTLFNVVLDKFETIERLDKEIDMKSKVLNDNLYIILDDLNWSEQLQNSIITEFEDSSVNLKTTSEDRLKLLKKLTGK
jgi:hypothetical protein